jgi:hypothetical protein
VAVAVVMVLVEFLKVEVEVLVDTAHLLELLAVELLLNLLSLLH